MKIIISIGFCITLLSGCGAEIAYKQGATAQDLQAEKNACREAGDEQALNQCLEKNGWAIQKMDGSNFTDDDLFATASVTEDNRMTAPAEKTATMKTTESIATQETPQATDKPDKKVIDTSTNTEEKSIKANPSNIKPKPSIKPQKSIFDTYVIKSWWKMGGGAALLEKNMLQCNAQLGEAHKPNKKTFTFTRGFAICMRQKGWRGLIER